MSQIHGGLRAQVRDLPSFRVFLMFWGGLLVVDLGAGDLLTTCAVTVAAAAFAVGGSRLGALLVAGTGWLVLNGFVVHAYGVLAWEGWPDLARLAVLVCCALAGAGLRTEREVRR